MIGALMAGALADRCGRVKAIVFGCLWVILGAALQASAYDITWMCFGRVLGDYTYAHEKHHGSSSLTPSSWNWCWRN